MNHYLKYISEIFWPTNYEKYISCRDKQLPKSISLVDFHISLKLANTSESQIISLLSKNEVELKNPNIYIPKHYIAEYDWTKWWLGNNVWHKLWLYYIQESSAALSASLLDLSKWDIVLDMCASPWGKSVQILNQLNNHWWWILVSNEIDRSRTETLKENIYKYGFTNDVIISHDAKYISKELPKFFDKILVDAPCSGEWTCHRSTKFLDKWSLDLVHKTAKLQLEILDNIYDSLKVGWILVYSTCTINTYENEWVVAKFLANHSDMRLADLGGLWFESGMKWYDLSDESCDKVVRLLPHIHHTGGFFVAKFVKSENLSTSRQGITHISNIKQIYIQNNLISSINLESKDIQSFCKYIYDKFDFGVSEGYFYQNGEYIYYVNGWSEQISQTIYDLNNKIFKSVAGIAIAKISRKWYILEHAFGKVFGKLAKKSIIYIDNTNILTKLVSEWSADIGEDVLVCGDNDIDNQFIFAYRDMSCGLNIYIWIGKLLPNGLKFNCR